jgi:hypothetical protein
MRRRPDDFGLADVPRFAGAFYRGDLRGEGFEVEPVGQEGEAGDDGPVAGGDGLRVFDAGAWYR